MPVLETRTYIDRPYGRNDEVAAIYRLFEAGRDVSMHGPRRLGKTFLLDRLVDAGPAHGWRAIKVEIAGCGDTRAVFRQFCNKVSAQRSWDRNLITRVSQRVGQVIDPSADRSGEWIHAVLNLDHEALFERLVKSLQRDQEQRWALLIDELPIVLKALHDKGPDGVASARNFMNGLIRLREENPRVRWMITGSIGITPLARAGDYLGVMAKFRPYELLPLTSDQARHYLQDLARDGYLQHRTAITDAEAQALIAATGWLAPYYLEALAQKVSGQPSDDPFQAVRLVEEATMRLLQPGEAATFGPWEEHLRKHYRAPERGLAFAVMTALAPHPQGLGIDALLAKLQRAEVTRDGLRQLQLRLHDEGFITWDDDEVSSIRNPLLRRWWVRHRPHSDG
jgi:hypothetical protein